MADEPIIEEEVTPLDSEPEADETEQDDDAKPFEGEYDPERARKLIDKLRLENNELKQKKDTPKVDPQVGKLETENLQLRIALELGIPEKLATRLRGSNREELIEDAHELLETVSPRKETPESKQPRPRLKGGSQPDEEPELSAKDIVAAARRR